MGCIVIKSGDSLFLFDEDEDNVTTNWFETIYKNYQHYLADNTEQDMVRPRRMPVRIDVEAMS